MRLGKTLEASDRLEDVVSTHLLIIGKVLAVVAAAVRSVESPHDELVLIEFSEDVEEVLVSLVLGELLPSEDVGTVGGLGLVALALRHNAT